jgi:hypothetical protein
VKLKSAQLLPHRKAHIGFLLKGIFYIYGGLDENDSTSDSLFCLDLLKKTWEQLPILGEIDGLYDHRCAIIGNDHEKDKYFQQYSKNSVLERGSHRADSQQELSVDHRRSHSSLSRAAGKKSKKNEMAWAKEFKVFIFGGRNKKGEGNSTLWCLRPEGPNWRKSVVETKGTPPKPRIFHSMSYIKSTKYFAVIGGSHIPPANTTQHELIGDFFLFDLANSIWTNLKFSDPSIKRLNASVCENDEGSILMFGGTGAKNFVDGTLYKLTMLSDASELTPARNGLSLV